MYPAPGVYSPMGNIKQQLNKWVTGVAIVLLIYGILNSIWVILLTYEISQQEYLSGGLITELLILWGLLIAWVCVIIFYILLGTSLIKLANIEPRISMNTKWAGILLIIASLLNIVNNLMFVRSDVILVIFNILPFIPSSISFILIVLTFKKLNELKLCKTKMNIFLIIAIVLDFVSRILATVGYLANFTTISGLVTYNIIEVVFYIISIGILVTALIRLGIDIMTINEQPYMQTVAYPQQVQPVVMYQPQPVQYQQPAQVVGAVQMGNEDPIPIEKTKPEDIKFCKECGSKHHIEAKFCTNCGKSV